MNGVPQPPILTVHSGNAPGTLVIRGGDLPCEPWLHDRSDTGRGRDQQWPRAGPLDVRRATLSSDRGRVRTATLEGMLERLSFHSGLPTAQAELRDITELLAIRDTGTCPCEPAADLPQRCLTELDAEMAHLTTLRGQMVAMARNIPSIDCPPPQPGAR